MLCRQVSRFQEHCLHVTRNIIILLKINFQMDFRQQYYYGGVRFSLYVPVYKQCKITY